MMYGELLSSILEIHASEKPRLKNRPIIRKIPLILIGLGLVISLLGVILIPQSSPITSTASAAIPLCASGLFLLLIGLILVFVFYLRRQRKK